MTAVEEEIPEPSAASQLAPGQSLEPGESIISPGGDYKLLMQAADGNLVLYKAGGKALWASGPAGAGAKVVMQGDGNLVVYLNGVAKWNSNTHDFPGSKLILQNDGNLVVYYSRQPVWDRILGYLGDRLRGEKLAPGRYLVSANHQYKLVMQPADGNLVLYQGSKALWSTTPKGPGAWAAMQGDGNLVVYLNGVAKWSSNTAGFFDARLILQNDSNLVVYHHGHPIWAWPSGYIGDRLVGNSLQPGDYLLSADHRYQLVMQASDGNLVEYQDSQALWSTTPKGAGTWAVMQGDGNFVTYNSGVAKWNTQTAGHPGASVILQNDANLVVYQGGTALWSRIDGLIGGGGQGQAIVNAAASQAGRPYCWAGGNWYGPTTASGCGGIIGFDCTGLTMYAVFQATGIKLGRFDQASRGTPVAKANLQPGDLVFFGSSLANYSHAGVYAGGGRMWDAADWGQPVALHNLYSNYVGAARYWR